MAEFSSSAFGLAALMLAAQTLEALKSKGLLTEGDAVGVLNTALGEFRTAGTPVAIEAGAVLLQFYNATPDINLIIPKDNDHAIVN